MLMIKLFVKLSIHKHKNFPQKLKERKTAAKLPRIHHTKLISIHKGKITSERAMCRNTKKTVVCNEKVFDEKSTKPIFCFAFIPLSNVRKREQFGMRVKHGFP